MKSDTLDILFSAALRHAEDSFDPDHEIGDLQDLLRAAWVLLPRSQKTFVLDGLAVGENLDFGSRDEFDADDLIDLVESGQAAEALEKLFLAADQHQEDNGDPSDAASDLQRLMEEIWYFMDAEQRLVFLKQDVVKATLEAGGGATSHEGLIECFNRERMSEMGWIMAAATRTVRP